VGCLRYLPGPERGLSEKTYSGELKVTSTRATIRNEEQACEASRRPGGASRKGRGVFCQGQLQGGAGKTLAVKEPGKHSHDPYNQIKRAEAGLLLVLPRKKKVGRACQGASHGSLVLTPSVPERKGIKGLNHKGQKKKETDPLEPRFGG